MKNSTFLLLMILTIFTQCETATKQEKTTIENVIVVENKLEGTLDWLIDVPEMHCDYPDHQYCRRPEIEGYCSQTSYKVGEQLNIFISTDPPSTYSLDIFRMGYYDGDGGRLMTSIEDLEGKPQTIPDAEPTNLIECKWDTAYQMTIPEDWVSGVYLGKLTTKETSHQSYVLFIVKDDREADIMFQSSDMTWQAYNRWPYWHSMYDEGYEPWVNTNGARISFDRPYGLYINGLPMAFNGTSNGSGEFLLWEFSLSFWLEKEGYDVTYISNIDTHADGEGLLRSKALLSVGHDEYWTPEMHANVSNARDNGVNLLFLCGNAVDGLVYLDPSWDGRANRITGRMPQRFLDDEEELMGNTSYGVGYTNFVASNTDHWVFDNTGMKNGDTIPDLIGWEYHGYPLKNDPTLVVLSENPIDPNKHADPEPEDYATVVYTAEKGNYVFNAGTCIWNLPLSTPPGFQNPINDQGDMGFYEIDFTKNDSRIQQMTKNLLAKALN